jgi:hypothetical protein
MTEVARPSDTSLRDKAARKLVQVALGKATGLGLALRLHRLELGLSIRGVSRATGVSDASICPEARANRRLVLELRDEISENSGYRTESQDWSRAYELIESLLEVMP